MGQAEHLHDRGTDKLIAAARAYDPTRVNVGEQDEVPEKFDEFTGPCDSKPAATLTVDVDVEDFKVGLFGVAYKLGILDAVNAIAADDELRSADKLRLVETVAAMKYSRPAAPTRQG